MPLCMTPMPLELEITSSAPASPKIAPEAPSVRLSGSSSMTPTEPAASDTK